MKVRLLYKLKPNNHTEWVSKLDSKTLAPNLQLE